MTKKKIYFVIALAALIMSCAAIAVFTLLPRSEKTNAAELTVEKAFLETYEEGEWLDIPSGTLTVNGTDYNASAVLYYPDGSVSRESGCYLTGSGKYTVVYSVVVNGKMYSESKEFVVNADGVHTSAKIMLDYAGYTENDLPNAVKGVSYKIFEANAYVRAVSVPVTTEVCYLYGEHSGFAVSIRDGAFLPERAGTYEITYTAKNLYGEETVKTISVTALETADELSVKTFSIEAVAGKKVAISVPEITFDERAGQVNLTLCAKKGNSEEIVYDGKLEKAEIEYIFEKTGEWELVWKLSDYSRTVESLSSVSVSAPAATFEESYAMPEPAFIAGRSYKLPEYKVVTYDENGKNHVAAEVSCLSGNGNNIEIENGILTLPESGSKIVTLTWTYEDAIKRVTLPVRTMVSSEGEISPETLFVLGSGSARKTEDGTSIDIAKAKSAKFINKLSGDSVSIYLYASSFAAGRGFSVTLTDSLNQSLKITVEITLNSTSATAKIKENGYSKKIDQLSEETLGKEIRISYSATGEVDSAIKVNEKYLDLPESFSGFGSGGVFAEITSSASEGKIVVTRINGQRLGEISKDAVAPDIVLLGGYSSQYIVGDTFKTLKAFGTDVLDGYRTATLKITDAESGNYLKTNDGKEINGLSAEKEYEVTLSSKGRYRIQYDTTDLSGNKDSKVMYFRVYSGTAPELVVGEITQKVAMLGDKLVVPEIEVKSVNKTETFVIVYNPSGKGVYLGEKTDYTFTETGSHKVVIVVTDEEGNSVSDYYYVEVVA